MALKFVLLITAAYQEARLWHQNVFLVPSGAILTLWKGGRINNLTKEGRIIQKFLSNHRSSETGQSHLTIRFAQFMSSRKIITALQLLSEDSSNSLLDLSKIVKTPGGTRRSLKELLKEKHPDSKPASIDSPTKNVPASSPHPILFNRINESSIRSAALCTKRGVGPSVIDTAGWRHLYCSYSCSSSDLCKALFHMAHCLCTSYLHHECAEA